MFLALIIVVLLLVAGVIVYLLLGRSSNDQPQLISPQPMPMATLPPVGSGVVNLAPQIPAPTVPPVAQNVPEPGAPSSGSAQFVPPRVVIGEVLAEGEVDVDLVEGRRKAWYTFQVNTANQDITLFFVVYDPNNTQFSRTVRVDDYSQAQLISNAQITVIYADRPQRTIDFDRESATMRSRQQYLSDPLQPNIFSPQMRIGLVQQGLILRNEQGNFMSEMQVDLTGVADHESIVLVQADANLVNNALGEIQAIIDQIENRRQR